jgi:hypothetical protein
VVLVNSELIDKLRFGVLPSVPFRSSLRICFRLLPEPCGAAVRNPGAPPSTRDSAAFREATETHGSGSCLVGRVMRGLERLAVLSFPRPTGYGHRLALPRVSLVLDLEKSTDKARAACGAAGDSHSEPGESALGRAANSQRVAQAWDRPRRN